MKITKLKLILIGGALMLISVLISHYETKWHIEATEKNSVAEEKIKEEKALNDFIGTHEVQKHYKTQVGEGQ